MADLTAISGTVGIWSLGDFRPDMQRVSGETALVHRLCVRLQTPRGRFPWWPNFGTDIAQFLLSKATPQQIAAAAEAECKKDEQVKSVRAFAEISDGGRKIILRIRVVTATGPFTLTLDITQARLSLVSLQTAAAA